MRSLNPADGSERQMLFKALDELNAGGDLLVLDHVYVGYAMVVTLAAPRAAEASIYEIQPAPTMHGMPDVRRSPPAATSACR